MGESIIGIGMKQKYPAIAGYFNLLKFAQSIIVSISETKY